MTKDEVLSVGIDVGTSTTQVIISRFELSNVASVTSVPMIRVKKKEILYRSPIHFTPLKSSSLIDAEKVEELVSKEYVQAGINPGDVKTGAIIITGETARKENASDLLHSLSHLAGDFVVATAGPDLEAIIAGKGSGAASISDQENKVIANLDIGGGTTNIVILDSGHPVDTVNLDIGGRLIRFEKDGRTIEYIAPKLKRLIDGKALDIHIGKVPELKSLKEICRMMAGALEGALGISPMSEEGSLLLIGDPLHQSYPIQAFVVSGGVADFIYKAREPASLEELTQFGDIGPLLGYSIFSSRLKDHLELKKGQETIRATVVGAGVHTTEISGSTIHYNESLLPLRNVPVFKVFKKEIEDDQVISDRIIKGMEWYGGTRQGGEDVIALALKGPRNPSFAVLEQFAQQIAEGMKSYIEKGFPLIVVLENDFAKALGQTLSRMLDRYEKIICIDDISVENGDYIDIGKPLADGRVVPVVVKTLIFEGKMS